MGVTGLWKLVEPCGKPVPVETLEGKILAVDISIWLHQVVKGFQDSKGNALPNAHLLGLFNRLCKLLYYRVKPVFVFDGGVPQLKRDTINKRHQQRGKLYSEADRIENLIVKALAQEKVVQQALGGSLDGLLKSPAKRLNKHSEDSVDDLFKLPDLPGVTNASIEGEQKDIESNTSYTTDDYDTEESSFEEKNTRYAYDSNLQAIDVRSKHFRELPAEVRHEILVDIKETRKHSWGRLHELPSCSNKFSELQMKRLLKRRAVQESLEQVEDELGGRTLTYSELINYFTEEGVLEKSAIENVAKPICSDENTRFLLVRDLKKKIDAESDKSEVNYSTNTTKNEAMSKDEKTNENKKEENINTEKPETKKDECLGKEYDIDLQLALALSAEDSDVYRKEDYEYESDLQLRLNAEQRRTLNKAAKGPARAYMIEYGGMNDDEVNGIMEETQLTHDTLDELMMTKTDYVEDSKEIKKPDSDNEVVEVMDTDTDSELEEVPLTANADNKPVNNCLEIVLDLNKSLAPQDDLFADVFDVGDVEETNKTNQTKECNLTAGMTITDLEDKVDNHDETKLDMKQESSVHKDSSKNIAGILDELKKQSNDATNINLDDIKVSNSIIELSDDDTPPVVNDEVITILSTPTKKGTKQSPKAETPSTSKITEYFQTNYVIKRTPNKVIETEVVPKVKSPFFIKKTPKSNQKESTSSPEKRTSKVSKTLFSDSNDKIDTAVTQDIKAQDVEEAIESAVQVLKENKSKEELATLASDLAKERRQLESERNRQDRMGMTISERMSVDCQELLQLFGIPYIVAPMEAEAQCAFLDSNQLTDGTITDDSDIWLFGGRTVYKNFFATNKNVLEYNSEKIENLLKCDRTRLIQLACLVGSDYTNGVHGIGTVTALEILASFTPREGGQTETNRSQALSAVLTTLRRFRDWLQVHKSTAAPPGNSVRLALCKKLKNIELDDNFPSIAVIEAYLMPKVDDNRETFSWGSPDVESIREFARKKFGWTKVKTDETLQPVMKKLNEKKSQVTIKNYFAVKSVLLNKELKVSKRIQTAVNKLSGDAIDEAEEQKEKPNKPRRSKRKQQTTETKNRECAKLKKVDDTKKNNNIEDPNVSRIHKLIHSREIIPQREKDRKQMEDNKKVAAEILKKASK